MEKIKGICKVKAWELIQECHNLNNLLHGAEETVDKHYWTEDEKKFFGVDETEKGITPKERKRRHNIRYWMKHYMEEQCFQSAWYAWRDYGVNSGFNVSMTKKYIKVTAWAC